MAPLRKKQTKKYIDYTKHWKLVMVVVVYGSMSNALNNEHGTVKTSSMLQILFYERYPSWLILLML